MDNKKKKNAGNDGAKQPTYDPDANMRVEYMPVCHQYKIGYLPSENLHPKNAEKFALEVLGCQGADGYLLTCVYPTPGDAGNHTLIFVRTGMKVPKVNPLDIRRGPNGIGGPGGLVVPG